jgi:hypothetical protein
MHVTTRIVLAIPIHEIGGIKQLFYAFPALLEWVINDLCIDCYEEFGSKIRSYFEPDKKPFLFCKPNNKSALAHMNQFKYLLEMKAGQHDDISQMLCDQCAESWQSHLISNPHKIKEYNRPYELWQSYLKERGLD